MQAFFMDRDGVINRMVRQHTGTYDSPQTVGQVALVEGVTEVVAYLNSMHIPVLEVSNQPGVAKGKMDMQTLDEIEDRVHALLEETGARIDRTYRCFHHPEAQLEEWRADCTCRKPKPGLFYEAAKDILLDFKECILLGDNATDIQAGAQAGCKTILFCRDEDIPEKIAARSLCKPDFTAASHEEVLGIIKRFCI